MKKVLIVLTLTVFFLSCKKEEPDSTYSISGKVKDISGQPVAGVRVYVDKPDPNNLIGTIVLAEDMTDAAGLFALNYTLDNPYDHAYVNLKIYQHASLACTSINGVRMNLYNEGGFNQITDGGYYVIESVVPAYYRIFKPQIPAGWENAYLNLYFDVYDVVPYGFNINNDYYWEQLSSIQFTCSTSMYFRYEIHNNDSTRTGNFSIPMVYGDTTDIVLPLFD
jgi:hypothetical protein